MKSYRLIGLMALTISASANAAVMNYVITGIATGSSEITNGSADIPINTGGSEANARLVPAVTTFVDFTIGDANSLNATPIANQTKAMLDALPTVATLRVTLQAVSGNGTETMIARTTNSQGLMDAGTISVLLTGSGDPPLSTFAHSATFRFDWRNAANNGPLGGSDQMVFTSYDIDFTQRNMFSDSEYSAIGLSPLSNLNLSSSSGTTTIVDPAVGNPANGTESSTDNPRNAYAFITVAGDNTQIISVDKAGGGTSAGMDTLGNQLYMFSFRSPSPLITVIPEPSAAILGGFGLLALLRRRR